jgi:hypothetical protein
MIYSSLFGPLPEPPSLNASDFLFNPPGFPPQPPDQILYIDALTGSQRTRSEFIARVNACARELCTPTWEGGLGLAHYKDAMVGMYSDNSLVSILSSRSTIRTVIYDD